MTDTLTAPPEPAGRFQFGWVPEVLFRPRQAFAKITPQLGGVWLTPMLLLSLTTLLRIGIAGWLKSKAAAMGEIPLPQGWEYYSAEQQAQFMQTLEATRGPVFTYVLPMLGGLLLIWIGWMLVGGLLHLTLTLLGGRGSTGSAMNVVAWAGLAWAIRDIVRAVYMLVTQKAIVAAGISGFAPTGEGGFNVFLLKLFALIDLFLIWHILLVIIGIRFGETLSPAKAAFGVILTVLLVIAVQAGLEYLLTTANGLSISQPFFF